MLSILQGVGTWYDTQVIGDGLVKGYRATETEISVNDVLVGVFRYDQKHSERTMSFAYGRVFYGECINNQVAAGHIPVESSKSLLRARHKCDLTKSKQDDRKVLQLQRFPPSTQYSKIWISMIVKAQCIY